MKWIDRAEARFGHLAIPGLLRIVAGFNALCFVLIKLNPQFIRFLVLDRELVLQGEVWRLLTYIFVPSIGGLFPDWFGAAIYIVYLIWIGDGLEQAMGAFRLNLFYLLGMLGTTVAAFLANSDPSGFLLNSSLFFAFARFFPETSIYLFFILPVKVKWMAWVSAAFLLLNFLGGSWGSRAAMLVALANFLVFFGPEIAHEARHRQDVTQRRRRFESATKVEEGESLHRCEVCGRTELVAPELEFRVAKDGHEYCAEHLPKSAPSVQA
jgi:hypothetical protein